jgi:hypothetical protein
MVLMRGVHNGTMYKVFKSTIINGCNNFVVPKDENEEEKTHTIFGENIILWHQILGHVGEKGLQALHGKGMVEGIYNFTLDFNLCEHFIYGKHNWVRFSYGATIVKGNLELIHNYLFGPMFISSLGKYMYYVSFINDFPRNTWIYFLQNKDKVFDKFKEFKALVESYIENKIKVLRIDNGGDFCENEFKDFCKNCGI